jgi:tetratricopeptide (TPR) repeat protein
VRTLAAILFTALILAAASCKDRGKSSGSITYYHDVAPIIQNRCATCHRPGEAGPFPLLTYEDVRKRASLIAKVTHSRFMPPWLPEPGYGKFADERRLSESEIQTIAQWVEAGCIEGKPTSTPAKQWNEGWQLGQPDLIVQMPPGYTLPAGGTDVYRNFVLPLPLDRTRYVSATELRVGTTVVHHAFLKFDVSGSARRRDAADAEMGYGGMDAGEDVITPGGQLLSWQPGKLPAIGDPARSWRLSKGADLVLQMHMRPNGKPAPVQSSVGFYFTDKPPTQFPFSLVLRPPVIDIPAGEKNYLVESSYVLPVDVEAVSILPHAHYLGHEMAGTATLPDGATRPLILIRNWDFNWQGDYRYAKPISLPKGTKLSMRFTFDNSDENIHNPNHPPKVVRYGPQSTDEMAELWLVLVPKSIEDLKILAEDYQVSYSLSDAIARSNGLLKYSPDDAEIRAKLGVALAKSGSIEEGLAELKRAAEIEPNNTKILYMRGTTLAGVGKNGEAIDVYEKLLSLDPENFRAHSNLGTIYFLLGQLDQAAPHFYNAVRIHPTDLVSNMNLAGLFLAQGKWGQARLQLQTVLEIDPDNAAAKEMLTRVKEQEAQGR